HHLAWAYSDLPGLTAWTIRLGGELFGDGVLAVRSLFLLVSFALPWLVVSLARREGDAGAAWLAGCGALVLPLFAMLGVMALPDVLLAAATPLAPDALTRMLRGASHAHAAQLARARARGARCCAIRGCSWPWPSAPPPGCRCWRGTWRTPRPGSGSSWSTGIPGRCTPKELPSRWSRRSW